MVPIGGGDNAARCPPWLYLQAEFTLYAVEAAVVEARRLWPRTMFPPPLRDPDCRAYELYAQAQQRFPGQEIDTRIADDPTRPAAEQDTTPAPPGRPESGPGQRPRQTSPLSRASVAALSGAVLTGAVLAAAAQELARWRSRSR